MSLLPFPVNPTHADVVMQDVTDGAYGDTFMLVLPAVLLPRRRRLCKFLTSLTLFGFTYVFFFFLHLHNI